MSSVPDFVPDYFATDALSIEDGIAALAAVDITVVRTGTPIELDYSQVTDEGGITATIGQITVSITGRLFVELYNLDEHLTKVALGRLETLVTGEHRNDLGWPLMIALAREYADYYLAEQVFAEQLEDTPHQCRTCGGRMSRARYGAWQHAKCEPVPTSMATVAERKARRQLFADATKAGA